MRDWFPSFPSLRTQLLVAMAGTAFVALGAAYFAIGKIEHTEELALLRQRAQQAAHAIALQAAEGAGSHRFERDQAVLGHDRLIVEHGGRRVFAGPQVEASLRAGATATFPGGRVEVVATGVEARWPSLELTLIVALALLLVVVAAIATATLIARRVGVPVQRAIEAADRMAGGDFDTRMGASGPEELQRLGRAFDGMAERLAATDRDQRRFLADVAHEIATPLSALSGFALALVDGSAAEPLEREEALQLITVETERLQSLLDSLRHLTQLDLLESVQIDEVELRAFLDRLALSSRVLARSAGVTLTVGGPRRWIVCDARLLEIIVGNFLTNAIRYTPSGGRITLCASSGGKEVTIAVRDTGIGIGSEHRARIFDRLYRVDEARDRVTGGSGLGLAIAQRAAHAIGGRIDVDSEPGRGSEFRLIFRPSEVGTSARPARTRV